MEEQLTGPMMPLDINDNPVNLRVIIAEMLKALRETKTPSREKSLAITKLQEAQFWLMQHSAQG